MQQLINTKIPALFYKDKSIFSKEELKLGIEGNRVILNKSLELSQSIGKYIGLLNLIVRPLMYFCYT